MYKAELIDNVSDYVDICGGITMEDAICYAVGLNTGVIGAEHFHFSNKEFHRFSPYSWCVVGVDNEN